MTQAAQLTERSAALAARLRELGRVLIAFSGGVDSSVLLHAAVRALGADARAVIADSPSLPRSELASARRLATTWGVELIVVRTREGDDPAYQANAGDRCFHCKKALFAEMQSYALQHGYDALAYGAILDDQFDDRPGARAAEDFRVVAPLCDAGFDKRLVRAYAGMHGLSVAEKPASACLASRIPVGTAVTPELLGAVERAEEGLRALGLAQLRVRHHGDLARLEVAAEQFEFARSQMAQIEAHLRSVGFARVDLALYRSPSERASAS